ncbi:MAG TPA: FAD-dependent oxidoreductase [Candidatus Acidoferrales bacterium]|nr:FAD-dependent oxidoreductase [Candidatus Acidoferrales bacterium]
MTDYKYVIVGGGMAAESAIKGIREVDKSGTIAVFSEEKNLPYNRPPLSKALWKGDPIDSIWRKIEDDNVDFFKSTAVMSLDVTKNTVKITDGGMYHYEKLLLATGGRPRKLPFGGDDIIYFRTFDDYETLRDLSGHAMDFVVIGGGFIGSEIAAALAMNEKNVTMIFPEEGIGSRSYPRGLSLFLNSFYKEKGVNVISGASVMNIDNKDGRLLVKSNKGGGISADAVVAGLGIIPNDELAKSGGLAADNGIIVDEFLRTSNHDIYAAGDVANFFSLALDKRMRVEHEDNANTMGKIAGHNMAGSSEPYHHLPFFYSDLFELGYEAVGEPDSRLEIFEDWEEEFRKGVIYYGKDGVVRGVLLWNTWGMVDTARELITSKKKFAPDSLKGLIRD